VLNICVITQPRNTIEFQNRELNTGSFPKGLALLFAANSNWNYDKALLGLGDSDKRGKYSMIFP
jgi:hypothetical protein